MIDVKEAVAAAETYVRELYPSDGLRNLRLEEVERSSDGRVWSITLGWIDPNAPGTTGILELTRPGAARVYKTLQVDATSGEVTSMKIRAAA